MYILYDEYINQSFLSPSTSTLPRYNNNMVKTIYITRHGFRANWLTDQPIPPSPTGIESDPALAEKGVVQAKELGEYLKDIKPPIQRIYASPFYRCIETATPTADHLDLAIYPEGGCGEWFKRERSSHPKPASNAVLKGFFPRVDKNYNSLVVAGDDGEDEAELHERTKRFLNVLIEKLNKEEPEIETILIVSHAAPRIALGRALVGDNSLDIRTGVCSLDTFEVDKEGGLCGEWKLKSSGQVDYLSEGEVMHWGFGEYGDVQCVNCMVDIHVHYMTDAMCDAITVNSVQRLTQTFLSILDQRKISRPERLLPRLLLLLLLKANPTQ